MSVTFTFGSYVEHPQFGTVLECGVQCDHRRPESCCEDAALYFGWCDHAETAQDACGCKAFDVNVSNANAVDILTRLGYEFDPEDPFGQASAEDFLGRATVGTVGFDDSGDPAQVDGGPGTGRATFIDCGRPAGYFDRTFTRLSVLATEAKDRDVLVVWS
jgi:hypothetical protein